MSVKEGDLVLYKGEVARVLYVDIMGGYVYVAYNYDEGDGAKIRGDVIIEGKSYVNLTSMETTPVGRELIRILCGSNEK